MSFNLFSNFKEFMNNFNFNEFMKNLNFSYILHIMPGLFVIPFLLNIKLRKNPIISLVFQILSGLISNIIAKIIVILFSSINLKHNSLYFNIFMIIFYYLYKSIDYLWFKIVKFIILFVETLLWYDIKKDKCSHCLENKNILINHIENIENTATCKQCNYIMCRQCYLKYYMEYNKCPQCTIIKSVFDIENITQKQYVEIYIKLIGLLIVLFM